MDRNYRRKSNTTVQNQTKNENEERLQVKRKHSWEMWQDKGGKKEGKYRRGGK